MREEEESGRWLACIDGKHISIGDPAPDPGNNEDILYIPEWFLASLEQSEGCSVTIMLKRSEELPKATSLTFQVLGEIPGDLDIRDLLEEPLSQLGVLELGQHIPVPALDGVFLTLEECLPEPLVFLDGAEIALDIRFQAHAERETQEAERETQEAEEEKEPFDDTEPMFSGLEGTAKFTAFQGTGYKLGS